MSSCEMFDNFVISYMTKSKKCEQTLERAQYGLQIILKGQFLRV